MYRWLTMQFANIFCFLCHYFSRPSLLFAPLIHFQQSSLGRLLDRRPGYCTLLRKCDISLTIFISIYIVFTILLKASIGAINKDGEDAGKTFSKYCVTLFFHQCHLKTLMILDLWVELNQPESTSWNLINHVHHSEQLSNDSRKMDNVRRNFYNWKLHDSTLQTFVELLLVIEEGKCIIFRLSCL